MKWLLVLVLAVVALSGCRGSTEYGECLGIADDRDSTLTYKVSIRNAVIGAVFVETIVVPVVVLASEVVCPVGHK